MDRFLRISLLILWLLALLMAGHYFMFFDNTLRELGRFLNYFSGVSIIILLSLIIANRIKNGKRD